MVTAQKREERLQDVPIAITVVSREQLASQRVYSIADLARTSPSLEMIQAFGGPGGGGQIRGIGTQSFTRSAEGAVGIVVDGVPQGNVPNNAIFDIAQVEVLRGPQGTLFGLTSSAGVINITTVAPDPTAFSGSVQLDWSDAGTSGSEFGQQVLRGAVNLPVGDASALRIAVNANNLDGVQINNFNGENDELEDLGVRARFLTDIGERLTLNLIADYDQRDQNYADPQFVYANVDDANPLAQQLAACGIVASVENNARCIDHPTYTEAENYGFSAQVDVDLGAGTLTSISAYRKQESGPTTFDIMGNPGDFVQIFNREAVSSGRQLSQELRYTSSSESALSYVMGAFYSDFDGSGGHAPGGMFAVGTYQVAPVFVPFVQSDVSTETTNRSWALFGQGSYDVSDRFSLLAGLRYTDQELTDYSSPDALDPATAASEGVTTETNLSGKVGLQYELTADINTYATITRGYKGPQVIPTDIGTPTQVIAAEIPTAYEIGAKGSAFDGRLGFDVSLFHTEVEDYQGQRCRINGVGALVCVGESIDSVTSKGIEFGLFGSPFENLFVNAGFIYNIAEFPSGWTGYNPDDLRDPVPGTTIGQTDLGGLQLVGVPERKFTLNGEYGIPMGSVTGFIGGDAVYKSEVRLGYTADARFVYPAHWIASLRIGLRSPEDVWGVELFARNIGNENEPVTLFGGPSFVPPGAVPFAPNGFINGVSGWMATTSLRQVGISGYFRW